MLAIFSLFVPVDKINTVKISAPWNPYVETDIGAMLSGQFGSFFAEAAGNLIRLRYIPVSFCHDIF